MRMLRVLSLLFLGGTVLSAQQPAAQHEHPAPAEERLGRVHFATSCRPEVAASFDRAVALLHSFSFSVARKAFEGVLTKDPACAMAHWGIAMTNWGNPFASMRSPKALADGLAAVERARKTGQPTPRERAYIDAVATLFTDHATVDQRTRVLAYERAMEQVSAAHPEDAEAAAFSALAVNQTALPSDKTYAKQLKAAGILEKLFAQQPEHPGLTHYIIHAYDHPPLAPKALDAARRYAKIAPSAPHALHMPSHTFTRVGSWQESIDTNIESAKAAVRDGTLGEALHAMDYQVYAYLQTGQDTAARRLVDEAPRIVEKLDPNVMGGAAAGFAGLYAAAAIPARYTMERSDWAGAAALQPRKTPYHWVDAVTRFARAVGAARIGNLEAARADLEELRRHAQEVKASGDTYWAEQVNIQISVAAAWISFAEGRKEDAERRLRAAADTEDATDKSAISPGPLAPAREFLGEMLLALGRPADALKEFQATLRKEPNRFRATYYAARAAGLAGDRRASREYYRQLAEICQRGDTPGRPELQQARRARTS